MTSRELATVLTRFAGLWLMIQAFSSTQEFLFRQSLQSGSTLPADLGTYNIFMIFRIAMEGALALYALFNASAVVKRFFPECRDAEVAASRSSVEGVGVVALGLVLIAYFLPALLGYLGEFLFYAASERRAFLPGLLEQNVFSTIMDLAGTILGLVMLRAPERFSNSFAKLGRANS